MAQIDFASEILGKRPQSTGFDFASKVLDEREADKSAAIVARQSDVDRSGLADTVLRFNLGRADNFQEKQKVFKRKHTRGELLQVPESLALGTREEILFKFDTEDPNERFKSIERGGFEEPSLGELGRDVAEFVGADALPIAGELLALRFPFLRGAGIAKTAVTTGFGAATGEAADQGIQQLQGTNTQTLGDIGLQVGTQGLIGAGGAGVTAGVAQPLINTARGAGGVALRPGAVQAQQARKVINKGLPDGQQVPHFTPGQLSETPILQRLDEQSIALAGGLRQQRRTQSANVARATRQAADPRALATSRRNAQQALNQEKQKLIRALNGKGDFEEAGETLSNALLDPQTGYRATSQRAVSQLYDDAATKAPTPGQPTFEIDEALRVADDLDQGIRAVAREGAGTVNAQRSLDPELRSVINDLRNIDPNFPGGENISPAWEVLDNLRQRLFDLKTPAPGAIKTVQNRQAQQLFNAITDSLDSPIGGDTTFRNAWNLARSKAKERFTNLELSNIVRLAKTDETTGFAQRLAEPGSADALRQLGRVLDEPTMRQVTDAFKNSMANDLGSFTKTLDSFDNETLRRLLNPEEITLFRNVSTELQRLGSTGIDQALEKQARNRLFVRDLINRNDSAGATNLVQLVNQAGGRDGAFGRSLSAGIVDDIFEDVVRIQADGGKVTEDLLRQKVRQLDNLGLGPLLRAEDRKLIRAILDIAPFVRVTRGGAGASIQAADVAENIVSFGDPKGQLKGLFSIMQKVGYARAMQSAPARFLLIGAGRDKVRPIRTLAAIGAVLATTNSKLEQESDIPVFRGN